MVEVYQHTHQNGEKGARAAICDCVRTGSGQASVPTGCPSVLPPVSLSSRREHDPAGSIQQASEACLEAICTMQRVVVPPSERSDRVFPVAVVWAFAPFLHAALRHADLRVRLTRADLRRPALRSTGVLEPRSRLSRAVESRAAYWDHRWRSQLPAAVAWRPARVLARPTTHRIARACSDERGTLGLVTGCDTCADGAGIHGVRRRCSPGEPPANGWLHSQAMRLAQLPTTGCCRAAKTARVNA